MSEEEDVRVAFVLTEGGQLADGLLRPSRVFLHIVERAVDHHDPTLRGCPQGQRLQEGARLIREDGSRPAEAPPSDLRTALVGETVEGDEIVITGHADGVQPGYELDALVWEGPIADQVAGDQVAVDALPAERVENRAQRVQVAVDVGEDPVPHDGVTGRQRSVRRTSPRSLRCRSSPIDACGPSASIARGLPGEGVAGRP